MNPGVYSSKTENDSWTWDIGKGNREDLSWLVEKQ
jgi:hypothetical protein